MLAFVLIRGVQRMRERRHYCFDRLCDSSEGNLSNGNWTHCENFRGRERDENAEESLVLKENPPLQGAGVLRHEVTDHLIAMSS